MNFDQWRHYLRARLLEMIRRQDAAIAEYALALKYNPNFFKATNVLGYLHAARQDYGKAEHYFREALRIRPKSAETWFNLGYLLDRTGRRQEAIEALQRAVELKPRLDRAWYGLGMCEATLGCHEQAAQAFERVVVLQPMNSNAWYALGMAYHHLNDPERLQGVIEQVNRFDRQTTRRLIQDTERADLAHLVADMVDIASLKQ